MNSDEWYPMRLLQATLFLSMIMIRLQMQLDRQKRSAPLQDKAGPDGHVNLRSTACKPTSPMSDNFAFPYSVPQAVQHI